ASVVNRLRNTTASSEMTKKDLAQLAIDHIAEVYSTTPDEYNPALISEALSVIAEDANTAIEAINAEVDAEVARIREAASGKRKVEVVENNVREALRQALNKKAGVVEASSDDSLYEIEFTSEDVNG